jgi:hypothetical protein
MLVLARPTWESCGAGLLVAVAGECLRVWAAGHLEKGREVTRSGPYRFVSHPLYAGSMLIAIGIAIASRGAVPALVAGPYRDHDRGGDSGGRGQLRQAFGSAYDDTARRARQPMVRRFSLARVMRNRESARLAGWFLIRASCVEDSRPSIMNCLSGHDGR